MFTIRNQHFAALRKHALGEGLIRRLGGAQQIAYRDQETCEILSRDLRGNTRRITFDDQGFIGGVISPLGRYWRIRNDAQGKVLGLTNPAGLQLGIEYCAEGHITRVTQGARDVLTFGYDSEGQLLEVVYGDSSTTQLQYQGKGQLSSVRNRLGAQEEWHYNEYDLLDWIADGNGNRTNFRYGMWNRPERIEHADRSTEFCEYSPAGFVRRIGAGPETVAEIEHNAEGKPTQILYGDGNRSSFTYNGEGKTTEARNSESLACYQYDDGGRVVEEDQDGYVVKYHYDESGTLIGLTYPSGETVEYGYDPDLRLTSIKDWNQGEHHFTYTRDDRSVIHHLPNDLVSTVRQSNSGWPISIVVSKPDPLKSGPTNPDVQREVSSAENLFSQVYQYDQEERVHLFADSEFGTCEFVYDSESQLLRVRSDQPGRDESFAYDGAGNRIRSNTGDATFNVLNQFTREGDRSYEYDVRGNMVTASAPTGGWNYKYNAQNLLVSAEAPQGQVTFGYDAFGRRIWKRSLRSEVRFVWAGEQLIREIVKDESGTRSWDYLYFPGTYTPLATRVDGKTWYYHTDHLGTPHRMTDGEGNIVWSAAYSAFGEARLRAQGISNPLRFPGQYFDAETGLHYNRFRYYSPLLGRYLSRDPASFLAGLNFYVYADNNPVKKADPLGLWTWKALAGGAFAGLVTGALILKLAPAAVPVAILAAAMIAIAVAGGLNEAIHGEAFCIPCFWRAVAQELGAVLVAVGLLAAFTGGAPPALGGLAIAGTGGLALLGVSAEEIMLGVAGAGALVLRGAGIAMMSGGQGSEADGEGRDGGKGELTDEEEQRPRRVTNPKHHPNSDSPEPKNVDELFERSIVDKNGVRWAMDEDGIIHRFTKPTNGETHWSGSTAGPNPIPEQKIPIEIRRALK